MIFKAIIMIKFIKQFSLIYQITCYFPVAKGRWCC